MADGANSGCRAGRGGARVMLGPGWWWFVLIVRLRLEGKICNNLVMRPHVLFTFSFIFVRKCATSYAAIKKKRKK